MAKREWPLRYQCAHEGCQESVTYRFSTRRDLESSYEVMLFGWGNGKWRCSRHSRPNEVLSANNRTTEMAVVSEQKETGVYWGSFGFMQGPGFKAWAKDFPPGTKLIVTARIELPEATP